MYQEPTVFEDLTVAENVFAGRHLRTRFGIVDWGAMRVETARILGEMAVDIGPDTPVRGLGVADRQLLEIAKALSSSARLLIMDEPTAALSPHEVDSLFATVRRLRDRGVAVLYISHRLEEIGELADVVTVIRDGRHIETRPADELSQAEIIRLMVGRSLDQLFPKEEVELGDVVFRAEGLSRGGLFSDVTFELRRGEIVGPRRVRGRRPDRGGARDLRSRPARRGAALDRGPVVQAAVTAGRAAARARVSAGRPHPSGARSSRCRSRRTRPWPSCRS